MMSEQEKTELRKQYYDIKKSIEQSINDHCKYWISTLSDEIKDKISWKKGLELFDFGLIANDWEELTCFVHQIIEEMCER